MEDTVIIGLSGAQRTGKTTLAKAWSEKTGMPYVTISAGKVIASKGWECKDIRDPLVRIDIQAALVEECDRIFQGRKEPFISDRTPIDVAAYLLADMGQERLPLDRETQVMEMIEDCIDITNVCFGGLIICPPVLPYIEELGKPLENNAYQAHIHALILGLAGDDRVNITHWYLGRKCLDMEVRLNAVGAVYAGLIQDAVLTAEVAEFH